MKYFYRKKNTSFIRRLFKTRKNSIVNAIKFLLIVSAVVVFVIPYSIYFSTGDFKSFGAHSVISLLWFVAVVVATIFPISVKNKEPLLATKLKEYKKKTLKQQAASNGSQCIKSKKTRIRLFKTSILSIILLSFFVNTPVFQIHPFELKSFGIAGEDAVFRTGESVSFSWNLMGTPQKAFIVFGDGNIEDIVDYCSQINGMTCGSLEHRYSLQGKYTPILKVYYPGKTFSKNLDIWVENDAPLFSFAFNGEHPNGEGALQTSSSPFQAFEDEQVNFTVTLSKKTKQKGLTYQFNFGDHQITSKENSTSYAWVNQGLYPVTITVIGSQGELSKQTQYVEVLNKAPQAAFKITNGLDFAVGKKIKFTAEGSSDTLSDEKNLRYVWDWGDGLMDYGKIASHAYNEAGIYNVTLFVKDDDSLVNQTSRVIEIDNDKPEIVLIDNSIDNKTLTVNEGEEVLFTAISRDDDKAIFKLLFYWNFESEEFDPSSLENFELGGWKNRHVFEDDFEGSISVAVIDSKGEYNSDYSDIRVINVAPQISVFDANIFANVSFQVYRNDTSKEADFEFNLFRDDDYYGKNSQSFSNSEENLISSNDTTLGFSLLNQWKVIVNTTEVLPANSSFQAFIKLEFVNGQELVLSSNELFGGNYGKWEFNLSFEFFDEQNYSYKYPITIATQIFDPSIDEVQLCMSYQENKLLEISLSNALPISDAFTTQGIEYKVDIYEQDSKQFANITARKSVFSELFDNHRFPLKEELEVDIDSLIDVYDLLQNDLGLSDLSIIDCLSADNFLYVYALDDDLGNNSLTIDFETKRNVEMGNLTSLLNLYASNYHEPTPFGKIGGFSSTAYEGERVKFVSKANDEDVSGMTFMWDFGDGNFLYSEHAEHAWRDAGIYNVTLAMADPFGNIYYDVKSITILPKAPEIVGPFAFQGTEGSTVTLDVEIYDTYKDANNLEYFWYDNKGNLVSSDRKPVLLLNDGTYTYTLVVIDPSGQSSSKDITVTIHSLSPEIYVSSYMYHGIEGDYRFNTDGKLELTAYGLDTLLDSEKLYFSWTIRNGKKIIRIGDGRYQHFSKVTFYCKETTTYQGEVRVIDPEGNEKVATFQIVSIIDSTLDGIDDETEEMLQLSDGSSDTDGDGLTDTYEMTVSNTSYLDPDTDGDLLWDGPTVNGTIGEQAVSTDPLNWDSDNDFLSDGTEYFGWNITVVSFESTSNFHVTSDSLDNDTDNDGLSDYEEYYAGSNPRQADTDNDDLTDDIDPFPTKWDGDEDSLSDYEEIMRGTDYNNTDSDQDGLKDGEEVYGWGIGFFTNPLDADTDHDHVSDSAEIRNYLIKLQDEGFDDLDKKVPISQPVSLHFPHHFEQAVAAQISFGISFGEYGENATSSYGVEDSKVENLSIIITKKDDGMLLANFTTNNTRYFSQLRTRLLWKLRDCPW
jgi:PKD repeat protein